MTDEQKEIVEFLKNKVLTIHDFETPEEFKALAETFYTFMKKGFEIEEIAKGPIQVRFFDGGEHYPIQLNHMIVLLFMWQPIVELDDVESLNESHFIMCPDITSDMIKDYLDNKVIIPYRHSVSNKKMNKVLHDVNYNLGRISKDFNILMGLSIDIEQSFMFPSMRNERFDEILHTKVDQNAQISDNEKLINSLNDEMIDIIRNDKDNMLHAIIKSGTGIKAGQFKEFAVNGGYKPDLNGNTIPLAVNSNLVVGGLNSVTSQYVDSMGGTKAAVANATEMGTSGHIARLIILLSSPVKLGEEEDCGTLHSIRYSIKTKSHVKKFTGRYYRTLHSREYHVMQGNEFDLVGQDIMVRSPMTCIGGHDGHTLCKTCYGELHRVNADLNSVGAYGSTKNAEPVSQSILSTKHLLTTESYRISFQSELFSKVMEVCSNEIHAQTSDVIDGYSVLIKQEELNKVDMYASENDTYNDYVTQFTIFNEYTGESETMSEDGDTRLFIAPDILQQVNKQMKANGEFKIPLYELASPLFVVEIENEELTKPLYGIIGLLDKKTYREEEGIDTVDKLAQHMIDLVIISKIAAHSVHSEIILRELLRSKKNILKRPDFSVYSGIKDVDILTLKTALSRHPSITVSLSFQELKSQLRNLLTYEKEGQSFLDPYFKESL